MLPAFLSSSRSLAACIGTPKSFPCRRAYTTPRYLLKCPLLYFELASIAGPQDLHLYLRDSLSPSAFSLWEINQ